MAARFHRYFFSIAFLFFLAVMEACAIAPVQEMSDARQAIRAAYQVEADKLAPDLMRRARAKLDQAERALGDGAYQDARDAALAAKRHAISARKSALQTGKPTDI
jgi:hypothetical protein